MAAVEQLFRAHLAGTEVLGDLVDNRIYPQRAPQDASYPLIVYQTISGSERLVKPDQSALRIVRKVIQVDAYAKGSGAYSTCKILEAAIKYAVYTFDRSVDASIVVARVVGTVDGEDEDGIKRVSVDVSIVFNE